MKRTAVLLATLLACASTLLIAPAAQAAGVEPVPEVTTALVAVPGGQLVDERTAYWPELEMTLSVPDPRLREAVGTCPNGSVCAFSGPTLTGSRLSWTSCGTHSTTAIATVQSIANARSTGILQARYGTTVRASAVAQSWNSVTGTVDNVYC